MINKRTRYRFKEAEGKVTTKLIRDLIMFLARRTSSKHNAVSHHRCSRRCAQGGGLCYRDQRAQQSLILTRQHVVDKVTRRRAFAKKVGGRSQNSNTSSYTSICFGSTYPHRFLSFLNCSPLGFSLPVALFTVTSTFRVQFKSRRQCHCPKRSKWTGHSKMTSS